MQGPNSDDLDESTTDQTPVLSSSPFVPVHPASNDFNDPWHEPKRHVQPRRSSLNLPPQQHGISSGLKAAYQSILMPRTSSSSLGKPPPAYTVPRTTTAPRTGTAMYHNGISSPATTFSPTFSLGSLNSPLNIGSGTPPSTSSSSMKPELYYKMTDSLSPAASSLTPDRGLITSPFIPQPVQAATSTVPLRRMTLTQSDLPSYRKIQPERHNPRARKRSANISELRFSHFYHPTEKPFNRIRVWKNDRNLLFYDCDCGRRKAVQDLKKILNHVSKNCRLSETEDKCGLDIDSPYDGHIDNHQAAATDRGDMKAATPADIAAAAAILTMSTANLYRNESDSALPNVVDDRHGVHPH